ncbi:hypothetical protein [Prescottella equi]|uniref:hypothetical protein n=1 Tax=Rhodococcus hoagii TaxID=43767 RepID=UPI000A10D261|nr:hypothetical protein [Prescottella equi]ORJ99846.1 hypothetical protein A6F58_00620 [Prescottella equi]
MSDITADEYRTAAKVLAASWNQRGFPYSARTAGEYCEDQATRLEAESARDEYVETLADVLAVAEGGAHLDQLQGWRQTGLRDGIRAVLDRLAADGRLLPEGGIALTRREAEGFVTVLQRHYPEGEAALLASLRERLDAPPAVSVPDSGPDGTPEKPWLTWQDVPEGAVYQSHLSGAHWRYENRCGLPYAFGENAVVAGGYLNQHLAPFVRVDGDQA